MNLNFFPTGWRVKRTFREKKPSKTMVEYKVQIKFINLLSKLRPGELILFFKKITNKKVDCILINIGIYIFLLK
jgi:hypothetical protein